MKKTRYALHFVDFCRFRDLGVRAACGGRNLGSVFERLLKTNGQVGFVRFFRFGFDGVPRIVTGPDFLDFLVTFRDITLLN
ncbi:MAG: hypothetical protein ABSH24_21045 [Bryobacteraceae bacterium]|jgi:hypothetical protein